MVSHKHPRSRGKFSFTRYFQTLKAGDAVAVTRELSQTFPYSHRLQGRTGKVIEKRGSVYYVEVKDLNKPKRYCIHPIHLQKIKN